MNILGLSPTIYKKDISGHEISYNRSVLNALNSIDSNYKVLVGRTFSISDHEKFWLPSLNSCLCSRYYKKIAMKEGHLNRLFRMVFRTFYTILFFYPSLIKSLIKQNNKKSDFIPDVYFWESFHWVEIVGMIFFYLIKNKTCKKQQLWILCRFDLYHIGTIYDDIPSKFGKIIIRWLISLIHKLFRDNLRLISDSEILSSELSNYFKKQFITVPIPHSICLKNNFFIKRKHDFLKIFYAGRTKNRGRGEGVVKELLNNDNGKNLWFLFENTKFDLCNEKLHIKLLPNYLSDEKYKKIITQNVDIIVMPYDPKRYGASTSGVFLECITAGVIPVVSSDTWMAYELEKYGLNELVLEEWSCHMWNNIITNIINSSKLIEKINNMKSDYVRYHNPKSFGRICRSIYFNKKTKQKDCTGC
jgi:hypothetical protein